MIPTCLTLSREIRREGRSIARVNGRNVSQTILKELGNYLIDIHGQSEHLSLLNIRQHLGLLDRFADDDELLQAYREVYQQQKAVEKELKELRQAEKDAVRMTDLLNYQIQEIDAAHLQPGEEAELRQELSRLANAEKLSSLAKNSLVLLDEGNPDSQSISDLLGEVVQSTGCAGEYRPKYGGTLRPVQIHWPIWPATSAANCNPTWIRLNTIPNGWNRWRNDLPY